MKKPLLIRTGYDAYLFSIKIKKVKLHILFYKLLTKLSLNTSNLYTVTSKCDFDFLHQKFRSKNIRIVPNFIEKDIVASSNLYDNKILMVDDWKYKKIMTWLCNSLKIYQANISLIYMVQVR